MKTPIKIKHLVLAVLISAISVLPSALAQTTAFTYQGRLDDAGNPATGSYDIRFILHGDAELTGFEVGLPQIKNAIAVSDGLFTTFVDFGGAFDSQPRWLELAVKPAGSPDEFTVLSPRQPVTVAPKAVYANYAATLTGTLTEGLLPTSAMRRYVNETVTGLYHFSPLQGNPPFTVNSSEMVLNLNADKLDGLEAADLWKTGGNAGTTPGTHFLGTTDNQALEIRVNNQRALRIEPMIDGTPNVLAGADSNTSWPGVIGGTIGGGGTPTYPNVIHSSYNTIGGGGKNTASGQSATVGGGWGNTANNHYATVAGGYTTTASGETATVGGGFYNTASGVSATVVGGESNIASGYTATVGGGWSNTASGDYATVPGGYYNTAKSYAFAAGHRAMANHTGSFVWADSTYAEFASTADNQFIVRAAGGVGINTSSPQAPLHVWGRAIVNGADQWDVNNNEGDFRVGSATHRFKIGVAQTGGGAGDVWMRAHGGTARLILKATGGTTLYSNETQTSGVALAAGGGAWTTLSDRNAKENFAPVDALDVLEKVAGLPLTSWNYKSQAAEIRHLGPMAQDFKAAFGLGESDTGITTVDVDGVALAAIQGLNAKVENSDRDADIRIKNLEEENAELKTRLVKLEQLIEQQLNGGAK